jgi:hypothetical protein
MAIRKGRLHMKILVGLSHLAGGLALALIAVSSSTAHAARAVVVQDSGCNMLNSSGLLGVVSLESNAVGTASDNCNSMIQCKAKIANPTKKTIKFNGTTTQIPCSTIFGLTLDWQQVISASGSASLVCHINTCE